MRVWVVCDHEPLPIDPGDRKPMRAGMLCTALAAAGHETTWFTSTTDHYLKRTRPAAADGISAGANLTIRVLGAPTYRRNISPRRVVHNAFFAGAFERTARTLPAPDVVLAALPTTEAAAAAVRFARSNNIPSVIDVRDIWPDTFRTIVPRFPLALGAPVLAVLDRQARLACAGAASVVAVSDTYLRWAIDRGHRDGAANCDRVFPIGNLPRPVPSDADSAAVLRRWGIGGGRQVVTFSGSWGRSHDLDLVLEAARLLIDHPDIVFVLAGDHESQPRLRAKMAELPNIVLTGWLDAREMATLLGASDIGLLPYRRGASQSLPNKVFEFMAYGVYQISTLSGEVDALFRRTGAGRSIEPTAIDLANAIRDRLDGRARDSERSARISAFDQRFAAAAVYGTMSEHIAAVAEQWAKRRDQSSL